MIGNNNSQKSFWYLPPPLVLHLRWMAPHTLRQSHSCPGPSDISLFDYILLTIFLSSFSIISIPRKSNILKVFLNGDHTNSLIVGILTTLDIFHINIVRKIDHCNDPIFLRWLVDWSKTFLQTGKSRRTVSAQGNSWILLSAYILISIFDHSLLIITLYIYFRTPLTSKSSVKAPDIKKKQKEQQLSVDPITPAFAKKRKKRRVEETRTNDLEIGVAMSISHEVSQGCTPIPHNSYSCISSPFLRSSPVCEEE